MMLRRTVLLATVPLMLLTGGTFALAQSNQRAETVAQQPPASPGEARPEPGDREMRWMQELNLTTEQTQQIQTIHEQARSNSESLRQQFEQAHEQMRSLMAGNASTDQLRRQHQQIQDLKQQLDDQRFETMLAVREILTPEQRAQMAESAGRHHRPRRGPQ